MIEPATHSVQMPPTKIYPEGHKLVLRDRVLVAIGSNGSGKTRFGSWLEKKDANLHHRVSAHRSLSFPDSVNSTDIEEAELLLRNGRKEKGNDPVYRNLGRWHQNPETALLNDFHALVTFLVSESFSVSDQYRVAMKSEVKHVMPPITRLDLIIQIWEAVLPDRELIITGNRIETRNRQDTKSYHAKEMSDGERGIFYLIGEALSVPRDGVFIVDEPELHLHRAIQARLWDAVESARPDCVFVYITHDLGFAASRKDATKVWLREYTDGKWDWEAVPESDAFPESLLLEVMGSRRPILFVEGDRSSLDYFIYGKTFPEHTVVPCGSCEIVVHSARSFTQMPSLHHNRCGGLVDNDGRSDGDIKMLNGLGIAVLPVAVVENLFLLESILVIAAEKLGHNPAEAVAKVKERVFATLNTNTVRVVSNLTRMEIEAGLRTFGKGGDGAEALTSAYNGACAAIDPAAIYAKWDKEMLRVLTEKDYPAALRYYKTKGLVSEAGVVFGTKFQEQVMRWLRSKDSAPLVAALRAVIPEIPAVAK
jgi:AAA domain, putative AbiEii toxin, Type IV TA system